MSKDLAVRVDGKSVGLDANSKRILDRCHFDVLPGELLVILGQSGCGKSTLLKLILALDRDFNGGITCGGEPVSRNYPNRGMVFQDPRLLPWMTALQNVEFAMNNSGDNNAREKRALDMLELVGLKGHEQSLPRELSGGMAQRTALARALVNLPDILLLDEPFTALDLHLRFRLQDELLSIIEQTRTTALLVTHDIDEALYLGDRILVMGGPPGSVREIYQVPGSKPRPRTSLELIELRSTLLNCLITS